MARLSGSRFVLMPPMLIGAKTDDVSGWTCALCDRVWRRAFTARDGKQPRNSFPRHQPSGAWGHTPVIPRSHASNIWELTGEDADEVWHLTRRVALRLKQAIEPEGLTLFQANGEGGLARPIQFHIHLVPRWVGDALIRPWDVTPGAPARLDEIAALLFEADVCAQSGPRKRPCPKERLPTWLVRPAHERLERSELRPLPKLKLLGLRERRCMTRPLRSSDQDAPTHGGEDPIEVVDWDPSWPKDFERMRDRAAGVLGSLAIGIEHVGSTSVPGLAAKPVIELDVIVRSSAEVPVAVHRLRSIGYIHEGDLGIPGREAFVWPRGEPRHHLYVCPVDSEPLHNHLLFRDYLRNHPGDARRYADAKRKAAHDFPHDRRGYAEAKREVGEEILRLALAAQVTG